MSSEEFQIAANNIEQYITNYDHSKAVFICSFGSKVLALSSPRGGFSVELSVDTSHHCNSCGKAALFSLTSCSFLCVQSGTRLAQRE